MESDNGISSIYLCEQVSSVLTSAGIGNHAVRPKNGRLFPLILIPDHVCDHDFHCTYAPLLTDEERRNPMY